ncbi:MAG: PilT protein [Myxococcales bacterium]|nr:PilT protein [Myxococcales bacterium]
MIVLDTSVLSLAFRRPRHRAPLFPEVQQLGVLIKADAIVAVPGIVLQEVLSGVKTREGFTKLEDLLGGFPLLLATRDHHVVAAEIRTTCRAAGVAASGIDCLIAAHAISNDAELFTTDDDFRKMAPHCRLALHKWKA